MATELGLCNLLWAVLIFSSATTESHPSHSEFLPEKVKVKSSEGRKATAQPLLDPSLTMLQAGTTQQE